MKVAKKTLPKLINKLSYTWATSKVNYVLALQCNLLFLPMKFSSSQLLATSLQQHHCQLTILHLFLQDSSQDLQTTRLVPSLSPKCTPWLDSTSDNKKRQIDIK